MLSPDERHEIREAVLDDLIEIERQVSRQSGSFTYLCSLAGHPTFTHHAYGAVIRHIPHPGAV